MNKWKIEYLVHQGLKKFKWISKGSVKILRLKCKICLCHNSMKKHGVIHRLKDLNVIISWNKLGPEIRKIDSISEFKKSLLGTIRPDKAHSIFKIHDPENIKHIYQLRVGLSQLKSHKKNHNFRDTPTDFCQCGTGVESTEHFLLYCPSFSIQRDTLISTISPIFNSNPKNPNIINLDDAAKVKTLLYGNKNLNLMENKSILNATIQYIISTNRLSQS